MKVTAVTPFVVDPGYGKNWLFVKVETSDGLHGWGECYTQADRDQSIVAHVRQLARYLIGRDAGHIRHFTHWAYHDYAPSAARWTSERGQRHRAGALGPRGQAPGRARGEPARRPVPRADPRLRERLVLGRQEPRRLRGEGDRPSRASPR